jgi:hypothetical protein
LLPEKSKKSPRKMCRKCRICSSFISASGEYAGIEIKQEVLEEIEKLLNLEVILFLFSISSISKFFESPDWILE